MSARHTSAFLVIRHGKMVCEWYGPDQGPDGLLGTASMAKAIVGGMSLLTAMDDGVISPDDPASKHIPAWQGDPKKSSIRIRHLATHTSGIEDAEQDGLPHAQLPGWKGAFWRREPDPFSVAIHQAPVIFKPGENYQYSNPGIAALAYAVTYSLREAPQKNIRELLAACVLRQLGVSDSAWSIGYGRPYELNGLELYATWGGGAFTPRATAAIGALMLHRGEWNHRQLIGRKTVEQGLAFSGMPISQEKNAPASGLAWWLNTNGAWPCLPSDAFAGAGAGHQLLMVVPSLDLIVVRNGQILNPERRAGETGFWSPMVEHLMQPLSEAIKERTPYPPSGEIQAVHFGPPSMIRCDAVDSDNWPITWGDDGEQYTAYGDGWGFNPRPERKLSLGFAKVAGGPENITGFNLPSASGERTGDGIRGQKASGLIMVHGVLYMWVRNSGNAQLAWSEDHGKTWTWGFRFNESFGSPSFLNYGKNNEGARDDFIYSYSQDGGSAYEADDGLILARAPSNRLRDRTAWEFLERIEAGNRPVWTTDLAHRGDVFRYPRHCQRLDAVYHPHLKRYLLALGYDHAGGWGIYDAPEPWGPWTTVFHTGDWGLGGTHGYRLPSKWISPDGVSMTLIFSGLKPYDAFCTRPMTLQIRK